MDASPAGISADSRAGRAVNFNTFDLNLLVVLDALLAEASVTRASARLHMTQPATSAALARLRRQLGDEILVRDGRNMRTTPYASALRDTIRDVLSTLDNALNASPVFDPTRDSRTFRISASDYASLVMLRPLIARLEETAPAVRLSVTNVNREVAQRLSEDSIDLAIIPREIVNPPSHIESAPLWTDEYVCAVWTGNNDVGDSLSLEQLAALPGLGYAHFSSIDFAEREIEAAGITRNIELTTTGFALAPFLLRGTRLVGLVHRRWALELAGAAELRLLECPLTIPSITETMLWHPRHSDDPAHRWLREQILDLSESLQEP